MKQPLILLVTATVIGIIAVNYKEILEFPFKEQRLSNVDGKMYSVKKGPHAQEAADTLALINQKCSILVRSLPSSGAFAENNKLLQARYNPGNITENILSQEAAFTLNKGEQISFCLRTVDNQGRVYDINTLMYVAIHELAHIGCKSTGHTPEFIEYFRYLIKEGMNKGVYRYIDYSKNPVNYCGVVIDESIV